MMRDEYDGPTCDERTLENVVEEVTSGMGVDCREDIVEEYALDLISSVAGREEEGEAVHR